MGAPQGNQFWKNRSTHGREKLFKTPELLWEAACEYFEWCDNHPWLKHDTVKAGDRFGENVTAPVSRPYTLSGLCIYLDCNTAYFRQMKQSCNNDFSTVITRIEEVIYTQKFEGAAVGAFNANIIARDLGLVDRADHTTNGKEINTGGIDYSKLSKETLDELDKASRNDE